MESLTPPPVVSPNDSPAEDNPPRISWRIVVALFVVSFVLRFAYFYLDDLTRQQGGTFIRRLLEEGTGHLSALLLFPLIAFLEHVRPVDQGRWRRVWPVHLLGYLAYSAAHTTAMAGSRALIFPLLGRGQYDYGVMSVRYFMESAQDFVTYATILGLLTLVRVQHRLRERERRALQLERDAANARLEALSLRLQPHFLFNALNTISSTVYEDPVVADEMIGRLGELLRRALHTADQHEIRLEEELETLRAYLSFVEARFGDRLTVHLDVDEAARELAVPALLLQPLIENAVRHGSTREFGRSAVSITVRREANHLAITVENDVDEPADQSRTGTGLGTTKHRLALLYGSQGTLETSAVDGRFRVTVHLPLRAGPAAGKSPDVMHARADR
jgi:LytS/YehU family sensor histidine kinase